MNTNTRWFKLIWGGWCEWPVSWQGWLLTVAWAGANAWYFVHVDSTSHSGSDTLIGVAPFFIVSSILLTLIARFTSK